MSRIVIVIFIYHSHKPTEIILSLEARQSETLTASLNKQQGKGITSGTIIISPLFNRKAGKDINEKPPIPDYTIPE
jgi:hypothetical protein